MLSRNERFCYSITFTTLHTYMYMYMYTYRLGDVAAMGKRKAAAAGKGATKLAAHNFLPLALLTKPASVIGDYISLQGKEWTGCPAADKEKCWYRCTVRQFEAMHIFGAFKSAGFEVQEMGASGEGSLEPGVASGEKFWVAYQQPFLKHYYAAHPDRLPDGHPDKPQNRTEVVGWQAHVHV